MSRDCSLAELRRGLDIAAQAVAAHGPAFLPIFLRMEREVAEREAREDAAARAVARAAGAGRYSAISESASARAASPPPAP